MANATITETTSFIVSKAWPLFILFTCPSLTSNSFYAFQFRNAELRYAVRQNSTTAIGRAFAIEV